MIFRLYFSELRKTRLPKWAWWTLAALVALQIYFVRELLAAFVIFTVGFSVLACIALVFYLVEKAGEVSVAWVEPRARVLAPRLREGSAKLVEELSKRPFRRPRSESAL